MHQTSSNQASKEVWARRDLRMTLTGLVFLLVTGLAILFLPFSTGAQTVVLAHTLGGLLALVPLAWFLVPHLREHGSARLSHLSVLGWASGVLVVGAFVTGAVLTAQAVFGSRISYAMDLAHIVGGCAAIPILGAHLVTAVRKAREREPRYVRRRLIEALAVGLLLSLSSYAAGEAVPDARRRAPLPADYGYRYGENPFAPSQARTDLLYRVDQDRRWVAFLKETTAAPEAASDERLKGFLEKVERAHAGDVVAKDRGEIHPDVLGGFDADAGRIGALRGALAVADPAGRSARLATLLGEVEADLAANEAEFRREGGIHPDALAGSESCGTAGCHEEIVAEWQPSAHRYSSRSAFFQLIQKAMAEANGAESTRYCAGCHDPIALFSGSKNLYDEDLSSPGADEGVSCASCHSIVRTDVDGNANFTMAAPVRYLAEDSFAGRFLLRAYPRHHKASYARPLLGTPELCAACHKQFIDKELNRATRVQLQNQYDAWKGSHWFVADEKNPQREDPAKTLACKDCHMRLGDSDDPGAVAKGGKHRHHGFIAANQWLPLLHGLPHADRHVALTEEWLQGKTTLPEIADRWPGGPVVPVSIEAPAEVRAGEKVRVRVTIENAKVGHTFPTGPLDVIQTWVDVRAVQNGREVFRSGALDDRGFIQEGAFELKAEGVDRAGNLIDKHNLWDMVGARFRRAVHPGTSDTEEFSFSCEAGPALPQSKEMGFAAEGSGEIVVTAVLRYRKVNQTLLNMLLPGGDARAPVTDMSQATARIRVVDGS